MILDEVGLGVPVRVLASHAEPAEVRRLAVLGVRPGATVRVICRTSGSGAILAVGDARLAVSRDWLMRVDVRAC